MLTSSLERKWISMLDALRLLTAIISEVIATSLLKSSEGMCRLLPTIGSLVGYLIDLVLLSQVLKTQPLGPVYAIWGGLGTAGTAFIGWTWLGDRLSTSSWIGMTLVIVGVVILGFSSPPKD